MMLLCAEQSAWAVPEKQWVTDHGGSQEESHGHFILTCEDGGFLQIGETGFLNDKTSRILIVKTDRYGALLWKKEFFGGDGTKNLGNSAYELADGYLIAGALNEDSALIKVKKSDGSTLFSKTYDKGGNDAIEHVAETDDGFLLVGYKNAKDLTTTFFAEGEGSMFHVNRAGEELSLGREIDLNLYMAHGYRVEKYKNEFVVAGLTEGAEDHALMKLDSSGTKVIWSKAYGGASPDHLFGLDLANDGSIFVTGHTLSGTINWDTYTVKIDLAGNVVWERKLGNPRGYDENFIHDEAWGIKATPDGGAVVVAGTGDEYEQYSQCNDSPGDCSDVWHVYLLKYDAAGTVVWQQTFGETEVDWAGEDIDLTSDGGAIVAVDNGQFGFLKVNDIYETSVPQIVDDDEDRVGDNSDPSSFVERLYTNSLGRASDLNGLNAWLNIINTQSAAAVAHGFLNSAEFLNKNLDDPAFIDILYRTLFDREGDADGVAFWMDQLGAGKLREMVIWSFLRSAEFMNRSDRFGVTALNAADESAFGIRTFVERFYTQVLGRQPDKDGFDYWVSALTNSSHARADMAKAFFLSPEYLSRNTSDDAFVTACYWAFFGREPDGAGKQTWMTALGQGISREQVLDGFIDSAEFEGSAGEN